MSVGVVDRNGRHHWPAGTPGGLGGKYMPMSGAASLLRPSRGSHSPSPAGHAGTSSPWAPIPSGTPSPSARSASAPSRRGRAAGIMSSPGAGPSGTTWASLSPPAPVPAAPAKKARAAMSPGGAIAASPSPAAATALPSNLNFKPRAGQAPYITFASLSGSFGPRKNAVRYLGTDIGTTHEQTWGWEAVDGNGTSVPVPNLGTEDDAIHALVVKHLASQLPSGPTPAPASTAKLDGALDTIYGRRPKAKQTAFQLSSYGLLRRTEFDELSPSEQSTLLGDLSYIATTSKSAPTVARAKRLIDRFTPPGTPAGHVPPQPFSVPQGSIAGQTRVSDPLGTAGLLKVLPASKRGRSGDGWTRNANGTTGPWGKYGASGIMLRHVGSDGQDRYLMVQRGPGISDPGKWQFPGGAIDEHENPYQGGAREVVEELGFTTADLDTARVHGTHEVALPSGWKYTSIAATVPKQLKPDLSTHHARMETSDAKWMTPAEIAALDTGGKLLKPLAGGQLQQNVMTLFPAPAPTRPGRPGPLTTRPARLLGSPAGSKTSSLPHKPSRGANLVGDKASIDKLRQDVKKARAQYAGKVADDRLAVIGAMQGFDDTPTVLPKKDVDLLLATGDYIEAWRGVKGAGHGQFRPPTRGGPISNNKTAAQINEELRSGPAYYGIGMFGNGYYFGSRKSVASAYSDGSPGSVVRVLIPKAAAIADHSQIIREAQSVSSSRSRAKNNRYENGTLWDEGRYAAAKGIDVLEIKHSSSSSHVATPGKPAYNVVNRSVLIVEEA